MSRLHPNKYTRTAKASAARFIGCGHKMKMNTKAGLEVDTTCSLAKGHAPVKFRVGKKTYQHIPAPPPAGVTWA